MLLLLLFLRTAVCVVSNNRSNSDRVWNPELTLLERDRKTEEKAISIRYADTPHNEQQQQ